jgi:hypothetical protein
LALASQGLPAAVAANTSGAEARILFVDFLQAWKACSTQKPEPELQTENGRPLSFVVDVTGEKVISRLL